MHRLDHLGRERAISTASSNLSMDRATTPSERNRGISSANANSLSQRTQLSAHETALAAISPKSEMTMSTRSNSATPDGRKRTQPHILMSTSKAVAGRATLKDTFEAGVLKKSEANDKMSAHHIKHMEDLIHRMKKRYDEESAAHISLVHEAREIDSKLVDEQRIAVELKDRTQRVERTKIKALEEKINQLQIRFEEIQAESDLMKSNLLDVNASNRRVNANIESASSDVQRLRRERDMYQDRLDSVTSSFQATEAELNRIYRHLESEKERWCEEMRALHKYVENDRKVKELIQNRSLGAENADPTSSPPKSRSRTPLMGSRSETPVEQQGDASPPKRTEIIERAFKRIHELTKIEDIDDAVNKFINAEEVNNDMLNQNNELILEGDRIRKEIDRLNREIFEFRTHGANSQSAVNRRLLTLEHKLNESMLARERLAATQTKSSQLLSSIKNGVLNISKRLGKNVFPDIGSSIADDDLMVILGQLEEKIIEIQIKESASFVHSPGDPMPLANIPSGSRFNHSHSTIGKDSGGLAGSATSRTQDSMAAAPTRAGTQPSLLDGTGSQRREPPSLQALGRSGILETLNSASAAMSNGNVNLSNVAQFISNIDADSDDSEIELSSSFDDARSRTSAKGRDKDGSSTNGNANGSAASGRKSIRRRPGGAASSSPKMSSAANTRRDMT